MTFIDRLVNGLYWAGCFCTVLFAACALMALDSDPNSNETTIAAVGFAILSPACWVWGRAMRYILTEM